MKRTSATLLLLAILALTYINCSNEKEDKREPATEGYTVSFSLPNQSGKTIYTRTLGEANEFDLNSLTIYMFGETSSGSGYVLQDVFLCDGSDSRVIGNPLSHGGSHTLDPRDFQIALGKTITGTYAKRFYFAGNLGANATAGKLCNVALTTGTTTEADFKAAVQNMAGGIMFWPGKGQTCNLPMMSDVNGLPEVDVDLSSLNSAISVHLKRAVARFDIVNNTTAQSGHTNNLATDFTITNVTLIGLNQQGYVFPNNSDKPFTPPTGAPGAAARKDTVLSDCTAMNTDVSYQLVDGKYTADGSSPAFYLLPTNLNDNTTTIKIHGTYGSTGEEMVYKVEVPQGEKDAIMNNHLYKIFVVPAKNPDDDNKIDISLVVDDWNTYDQLELEPGAYDFSGLFYVTGKKDSLLAGDNTYKGILNDTVNAGADSTRVKFIYYASDNLPLTVSLDSDSHPQVKISGTTPVYNTNKAWFESTWIVAIDNSAVFTMKDVTLTTQLSDGTAGEKFSLSHVCQQGGGSGQLTFAGSNIYWDGTKLTFDVDPPADPTQQKMGVLFMFGSLVGLAPGGAWDDNRHTGIAGGGPSAWYSVDENTGGYIGVASTLYVPDVSAQTWSAIDQPTADNTPWKSAVWDHIPIPSADHAIDATPDLADSIGDYNKYTGDICKYLSKTGAVKGKWRLPTGKEFQEGIELDPSYQFWYAFQVPFSATNGKYKLYGTWPKPSDSITKDQYTAIKLDGTTIVNFGVCIHDNFYLPFSGTRYGYDGAHGDSTGAYTDVVYSDANATEGLGFMYCTSSGFNQQRWSPDTGFALSGIFASVYLDSDNDATSTFTNYARSQDGANYYACPVRCVRDE